MNGGAIGSGALSGAATGAAVGSVVPGIGTAIGAGVGAIGGAVSGWFQSDAQDKALAAQMGISEEMLRFMREQYAQIRADQAPYRQAGEVALKGLESMNADPNYKPVGYNPVSTIQNPGQFQFNTTGPNADPSYAWRLQQGQKALESSAAARGGYFSGGTGKELVDYGQGSASQEYGAQFGRWQNMFQDYMQQEGFNSDQWNQAYQRLYGQASLGEGAVTNTSAAGMQFATNAGNVMQNQGNYIANAALNKGDIYSGISTNATNQFMGAWGQQQQLNQMKQQQSAPTVYAGGPGIMA